MITIALFGAGGKMGCRLSDNLKKSAYRMLYVEVSEAGLVNLAARNLATTPQALALAEADVVILALPDRLLGRIAHELVPQMKSGALVIILDPAAAYAGELPARPDISFFVSHPCHPPVFNDETDPDARRDFFGGIRAKQNIVCALMRGPEQDYALGEAIARTMYAPVMRSHRVTVEQMAILEPAMAETVTACCVTIIREAMDQAIKRGVPPEAARDFLLGHINIPLAIVFGEINSTFSDGAKLIIEYGKQRLIQADWHKLFEPASVKDQVKTIVSGKLPPLT